MDELSEPAMVKESRRQAKERDLLCIRDKVAGKCLLMKIEHVAMYTRDIEALRSFYIKYFQATSNDLYVNPAKGFRSYFLSFSEGARLELMQMESIPNSRNDPIAQFLGIIHIAFSLGSREAVDRLSEQLRKDGFKILDGPRQTGDGYYECAFLDPHGNRIEITE